MLVSNGGGGRETAAGITLASLLLYLAATLATAVGVDKECIGFQPLLFCKVSSVSFAVI
jgi:hypothetical protein